MKISEHIALLMKSCPPFENERISAELFDERLGGAAVLSGGTKAVVREYTDGSKIIAETVRLIFGGDKYDTAENVCRMLSAIADDNNIYLGQYLLCGIEFGSISTVGKTGFERIETECTIKYLKGSGDV